MGMMVPIRALVLAALGLAPAAAQAGEDMTFTLSGNGGNCAGCEWIAAEGTITVDTPQRFREYVQRNGKVYLVALHSPGGDLEAGMELGALIRAAGATTMVGNTVPMPDSPRFRDLSPGVCASACAFSFMGGVKRILTPGDRLGMNQFNTTAGDDLGTTTVQTLVGRTLIHTLRMGVDPRAIAAASFTRPDEMYWFSAEEAIELGLDNSSPQLDPWRLEPYKKGMVLTTTYRESRGREVGVTLFCRASSGRWSVLVSESGPLAEALGGEAPYASGALLPTVTLGGQPRDTRAEAFEFQRVDSERVTVSVRLADDPQRYGGQSLMFTPNLGGYLGDLLWFAMDLPEQGWLESAGRNCI
jgi:hypothetical protein